MKKAALVVGARPQFIKAAPLIAEMGRFFEVILIHTGQHYDFMMSETFFNELDIPSPDYHLEINHGSAGKQTGEMIQRLEPIFDFERPDFVIVIGDTNSTLAGALAAAQQRLPLVHIEAGVRSKDEKLQEQINRKVTDSISDLFLCPSPSAVENLRREGKTEKVFDTGDILYDSLRLIENKIPSDLALSIDLPDKFVLMTLHRAEAVDNLENFKRVLSSLETSPFPIVFPVHPRTAKMITNFGLDESLSQKLLRINPLGFIDLLGLIKKSEFVITDSGGVQRESVFLNKTVFVARPESEWIDLQNMNMIRVVGYDFDLSKEDYSGSDLKSELKHLLRPSSKRMIEVLESTL